MIKSKRGRFIFWLVLLSLFCSAIVVGVAVGPIVIPFSDTIVSIGKKLGVLSQTMEATQFEVVINEVRLPRVLVALFVGSGLAVAGVAMQGLFRNPLVEPGYIGVSSGAALGAVSALFFGWTKWSHWMLPLSAFVGAMFVMVVILAVWQTSRHKSIAMLLLLGIGINSFFSAIMNVLVATSKNEQELRGIIYWLQGGLDARTWEHVQLVALPILLGILGLTWFSRELDMLLLGEEQALSSGVDIKKVRTFVLLLAAFMTGTAVAVSGIIGFVGLIIPHMFRLLLGPKHRSLFLASAFGGATFLIGADLVSRMILQPITLQVGVVSALIGAPLFIFLLLTSHKGVKA